MAMTLFDLAGKTDAIRISPYCWRTRLALAHKGLDHTAEPWRFSEKDRIAASGQGAVPVLVDGGRTIADSWAIMEYLEDTYPDRPLFDSPQAKAQAWFVKFWTEQVLHPALTKQVIADIFEILHPDDRAYFRESREGRLGMTIEAFAQGASEALPALRQSLTPLRSTLARQPFLAGDSPNYADYIVFGGFQWARVSAPHDVLEAGDVIGDWRERMLDLYDGLGRSTPAFSAAA
ncbi:MAG: glutathione S-transferase family protein [Maricaulaceae bacterium]